MLEIDFHAQRLAVGEVKLPLVDISFGGQRG